MNFSFVLLSVVCSLAFTQAAPSSAEFNKMHKYLLCVPQNIDQLAMEYDCEETWDQYRQTYLNAIDRFEFCAQLQLTELVDE